ncbi:RNA methyltransferase [Aureimonas fodinaquatilis]|uniref:RNA methyltransferase n=1 Tax=Aureimonas fodinaquatilis TaxID=2565783 RepID=A0A5B0E2P4_9HYPH|nr:RNA methyltransferase [Aureimonas fodinaquatilis]KAA0972395.1 RNA methyltransferase [Aureimonas fodinaquatilis]
MKTIAVTDPDDPRIEHFRDVQERDIVGRGGFIAEGKVVIDHLLASPRFAATSLLVARSRIAGVQERFAEFPQLGQQIPVYVAEQAVMDRIAGFAIHRGVLAHGQRLSEQAPLELGDGPILVAAGISNHDNMGSLFRNAAAFGVSAVLLDDTSCDPLYRKALRVSVGTVLSVPFFRAGNVRDIFDILSNAGFQCVALSPGGTVHLDEWQPADRVAVFFGSEGQGLPQYLLQSIDTLTIAMAPGLDSLNVSAAASITLHHIYTSKRP